MLAYNRSSSRQQWDKVHTDSPQRPGGFLPRPATAPVPIPDPTRAAQNGKLLTRSVIRA